jgi:SAM-dependent methyltransferase
VFALPVLEHSRFVPPMQTSVEGLFAISSAHILNGTLNVNETLRLANRGAAWLIASRGRPPEKTPPAAQGWSRYWKPGPVPTRLHRWEVEYFLSRAEPLLNIRADDLVLDIGSGAGLLGELLAPRVREIHCLDLSATELNRGRIALASRRNIVFHQLDASRYTSLSLLGDRKFSLVVCLSVLQYYRSAEEIVELLSEIRQHAASGARLLIADLPQRSGPLSDTLCLLRTAARCGHLSEACEFLARATTSSHRWFRRRLGLTIYTRAFLEEVLTRLGMGGEVLAGQLTQFSGRLHLLVRFPPGGGNE